jgi:hypothetical protein
LNQEISVGRVNRDVDSACASSQVEIVVLESRGQLREGQSIKGSWFHLLNETSVFVLIQKVVSVEVAVSHGDKALILCQGWSRGKLPSSSRHHRSGDGHGLVIKFVQHGFKLLECFVELDRGLKDRFDSKDKTGHLYEGLGVVDAFTTSQQNSNFSSVDNNEAAR